MRNYGARDFLAPRLTDMRDRHVMGLLLEFIRQHQPEMIEAPIERTGASDCAGAQIQTRN